MSNDINRSVIRSEVRQTFEEYLQCNRREEAGERNFENGR